MNIAEQIKEVEGLRGAALREKFREVTGLESRSNNRPYLLKRIIHAIQAGAEGEPDAAVAVSVVAAAAANPAEGAGPSPVKKAVHAKKEPAARPCRKRERDPRLPPPGTILEREHDGKTIRVKVLEEGFEFHGKIYRSLSAIAREVTSQSWNGYLYFRLMPYARRTKAP